MPEREDIDNDYKWNVDQVYSSEEEWKAEREEVEQLIDEISGFTGSVTDSPEDLLQALELYEKLMRKVGKLSRYASMKKDEDTREQEYQSLYSRAKSLSSKASSATSFIEPEIQEAGSERIEELVEEESDLERYRHYFDDVLRKREHTRSREVEEVVSSLSEVLGSGGVYQTFTNADLKFPTVEKPDGTEIEITQSNFTKLLKHDKRSFRRNVYEKFYDRIAEYRNTIGSTLEDSVKTDVRLANIRNYDTARKASLDSSNIPVKVYDNLVDTVRDNLDALHRHAEMKQEHLGVDKLSMWDVYMPLTEDDPEIDYEDAKEHVLNAVKPMGDEYVQAMRRGLETGWVDVYENRGKRSGAYSGGSYDTEPFILMNYQDDINSMYTLAHELGHSMHSYFTCEEQPYIYSDYPIFLAEVASTVNESLLTRYLLENVDDKRIKRAALSHSLENFRNTLYRQTMFADFEHHIHRQVENCEALTPDSLDEAYRGLKSDFYRPADIDDRIAREWMRIPHFYWSYYVFQYSTGMSAAMTLSEKIVEESPEDYLGFLKSGSSRYPLETLKDAGVDMSSPSPVEEAISIYRKRMDEMEKLL